MFGIDPMEDTMSALAVDYAAAPDSVRLPTRPTLVLVPTGVAVGGGAHLRPTRAARLLATGLVALALAAGLAVATGPWGSTTPASYAVTVQPGDTLSEIAAREIPDLPVGAAVTKIQLANRMSTGQVDAGEVLLIPAAN